MKTGEDFLHSKDIWHHPMVSNKDGNVVHEVSDLLNEYAKQCLQQAVERIEEKNNAIKYFQYDFTAGVKNGLDSSVESIRQLLNELE